MLTVREKIDSKQYFTLAQNHYGLRGHGLKLQKNDQDSTQGNFISVNDGWNRLPATVVNVETVNAFKNAYDRYYEEDMDTRSC